MNYTEIGSGDLLATAKELREAGYRLVQMNCSNPSHFEVIYAFDKGLELKLYKIVMQERITLPSITDFFPGAFLYENEIFELFGVPFKGISIDYKGRLYASAMPEPFTKASMEAAKAKRIEKEAAELAAKTAEKKTIVEAARAAAQQAMLGGE